MEFLRTRARCHRFAEEIKLIQEEQRRTFVSLHKASLDWDARVLSAHEPNAIIREGLACYAAEQADIRRGMIQSYQHIWGVPITEAALYTMDQDQEDADLVVLPQLANVAEGNNEIRAEDSDDSDAEDGLYHFEDDSDDD